MFNSKLNTVIGFEQVNRQQVTEQLKKRAPAWFIHDFILGHIYEAEVATLMFVYPFLLICLLVKLVD